MGREKQKSEDLISRLKRNYPDCEITQTGHTMTVRMPLGEVQIKGDRLTFYVAGEQMDEIQVPEDGLYEEIETFLLMLREDEKRCCKTLCTADEKVRKRGSRVIYAVGGLVLLATLGYLLFSENGVLLLAVFLLPVALLPVLRYVRLWSFRQDWVCPHCGEPLPLERKPFIPQMQYTPRCPHCGGPLMDPGLLETWKQEVLSEEEVDFSQPPSELPKCGGNRICTVSGIALLIFALFSALMVVVNRSEIPLAAMAVNVVTLLALGAIILALLRCKGPEDRKETPKIVVCEQKWIPWVGIAAALVGLVFTFLSFCISEEEMLWAGVMFMLLGLFLVGLGAWMLLARKNRKISVYGDFISYVSSFGRERVIPLDQIASVRMTTSQSLHFLDGQGKKLFSAETNMQGAFWLLEWAEGRGLALKPTKSLERQAEQSGDGTVTWREEDRTPLHDHMGAIRLGMNLVVCLFAAGCFVPMLLFLFTDLKMSHAVFLTVFAAVPMLVYYLLFAPVILLGDRPQGATQEWKSMHIKFPTTIVSLLALVMMAQVYYIWEERMIQVVETGLFMIQVAVVAAVLIGLFWVRTPKRLRGSDGFVIMLLCLAILSFGLTYGGDLAISRPARHYRAEVVERAEPVSDKYDYTLTIRLDDGKEKELNVTEQIYDLSNAGVPFDVCQKENFLGIRMIRLHLPEGTNLGDYLGKDVP